MADLSIRQVLDQVYGGRIRIPAFQRGFVWDPDKVAYFMDSLYKGYPFGSVLLWRTKQPLKSERDLGPYTIPERDPDYPIDYVLDGQQRLTSIFGVFQTELAEAGDPEGWLPIYFDYDADPDVQEPQFVALPSSEVDHQQHFPLRTLFDSTAYRSATEPFSGDALSRIDDMQQRFKEAGVPTQTFETDDQARVAIVFERVNRLGVELDTLQLLTAWTWSEDFDLQERFRELADDLQPFGFADVGEDTDLLLRCCAAVVAQDASPSALVSLKGSDVRSSFQQIRNGIKGAIDFLRTNCSVQSLKNLPYSTLLVPLSTFFATPDNAAISNTQREELLQWFWRSCFSRRYSSGVLRKLKADIDQMTALRATGNSTLAAFPATVEPSFFLDNAFYSGTVNTKTFVLLLAQQQPLSFVSGQAISLGSVLRDYNRNEFHHCYPQAYLKVVGHDSVDINRLANFVFMSSADNKILGGVAPSKYHSHIPTNQETQILERALCPSSLFDDDYETFKKERSQSLTSAALTLIGPRALAASG
jgi:hypothetical protein